MIFDTLSRCDIDPAIAQRLLEAIAFLKNTDFSQMETGRHEVNDWMYFLVQRYETKSRVDAKFEAHRKYADIQYLLSGHELMGYCDIDDARELSPFDEAKDSGKYIPNGPYEELSVGPGQFAVFLPRDCHKPSYHDESETPCAVEKIVVKVLVR